MQSPPSLRTLPEAKNNSYESAKSNGGGASILASVETGVLR
ncbi:hypothetical protein ACVIW2_008235 [Bradyrhizobium huanghuaihaiense]|uniref:Uncharacterized protein n=1 Tax=Bradyrhizobium huanghuaihaiense TaxID=990078 RepID=A0A562RIM2_9BRAD|nr:hypothetical protein IQ16_04228 [Bradyrhizobium huanghuaihaiense]